MATTLRFSRETPPHKGYYMVRWVEKWRAEYQKKDLFPWREYWNGKEWQDISDDDAFHADGNIKPVIETSLIDMIEWCEVEV